MGTALYGKLNGHRRLVSAFQFLKQRVEMVDSWELITYLAAVTVGAVFCGDVACHYFFSENVAVALYLLSFASA